MFDKLATHRVANLGWSRIRLVIRLDDKNERQYYLKETTRAKLEFPRAGTKHQRRLFSRQRKLDELPQHLLDQPFAAQGKILP